jgi:hypothetical protein
MPGVQKNVRGFSSMAACSEGPSTLAPTWNAVWAPEQRPPTTSVLKPRNSVSHRNAASTSSIAVTG